MNKNYIEEVNKFCILRQCDDQHLWGRGRCKVTYSEGQSSFYSVLSSLEGQGDIHCNIVEAVISNVMSYYGCKMRKEYPV